MTKKEEWKERFYERFGGEGTFAKTDENCILIGFTKKEVINFIDELLKEHKVEHCDNEDCPECQTKLLDKYKAELIEKVEKYKTYYNPIGDNINNGRTLACDDILLLIKDNENNDSR